MSSAEPTSGARRHRGLTTVKVDAETHRLMGDLAHLLERTRGQVVRDAVNAFAVWRAALLDHGADETAQRVALANARHQARLASGDLATSDAERAERSRAGTVLISPHTLGRLTLHERVELRRADLDRVFGAMGARNPRLVDPRDHGHAPDSVVILVDLDDPARFPYGELIAEATEILGQIVDIAASNARRPSLLDRAGIETIR